MPRRDHEKYPTTTLTRPFRIALLLCGIYLPSGMRKIYLIRVVHRFFVCLLMIVPVACALIVARSYYYLQQDDHKRAMLVGTLIWHCEQIFAVYFLISWVSKKSIGKLLRQLRKTNEENGIKAHFIKHKIFLSVAFVFMGLMFAGTAIGFPLLPVTWHDLALEDTMVYTILYCGSTYGNVCWLLAHVIFLTCCHFILSEIRYLNEDISSQTAITSQRLQCLATKHVNLSHSLQLANNTFGSFLFLMLAVKVPDAILILYNMICFEVEPVFCMFLGFILTTTGLTLIGLTIIPAKIYEEVCNLANWLLNQANNQMGISANGYFVITKSLMLTVASLIVTYLTLIIQSTPQTQPNINMTCTAPPNVEQILA